jgi:hypothetical protein
MRIIIAIALLTLAPALADAGDCTTRKSGSVTITTCSAPKHGGFGRQCRSDMSGSVRKTSCR